MRNTLIHQAMTLLGQSMSALGERSGQTANDWRRNERKAVEDYLEKVLPLAQRFFISRASLQIENVDDSDHPEQRSDFEKIVGVKFVDICEKMLANTREQFLREKFHLAIASESDLSDAPRELSRRYLEAYLAWWFFSDRYASSLAPASARQIVTFRDYYLHFTRKNHGEFSEIDASKNEAPKPKRLIIALFENPANYGLIQQFGDQDANVATWLYHQILQSTWVKHRQFKVNSRILTHDQYSYDYIRFRLDVGLATPVRHNAEEVVPKELLPQPKGRRYMRRFFQPPLIHRRQRRLGVARWIDHAVIPGNCLYFYDLESLPDTSLMPPDLDPSEVRTLQSGSWEAELAYDWIDAIEDGQDARTYRYFTEVVCASQRKTKEVPSTELIALLDPTGILHEGHDISYRGFWEHEFKSFRTAGTADPADYWVHRSSFLYDNKRHGQGRRMVAMYAALITDLRRAWHAIRIYEHSPMHTHALLPAFAGAPGGAFVNLEDERASFSVINPQDRLKLYTRQQIERLFKESWTASVIDVCSEDNIERAAKDHNIEPTPEELSFLYSSKESKEDEVEDRKDYKKWKTKLELL